jgi:glycogen phosphorylase
MGFVSDDSTIQGQGLRFVQKYSLVACSVGDLIRRFRRSNTDWSALPEKVAVQLNDTHPCIAVSELMRILLDEAQLEWTSGMPARARCRSGEDRGSRNEGTRDDLAAGRQTRSQSDAG